MSTKNINQIKYEEFKICFFNFVRVIRNELFFEVKESFSFTFAFEVKNSFFKKFLFFIFCEKCKKVEMMVKKPIGEEIELLLGILNKKRHMVKKRSDRNKLDLVLTMDLPKQKTLKTKILKNIFKFFSASELTRVSLVSKEWLELSRDKEIWENFLKQDFLVIFTQNQEDIYSPASYGRFIFQKTENGFMNYNSVLLPQLKFLLSYERSGEHPFIEYWSLRDKILENQAKFYFSKKCKIIFSFSFLF